MRNNGIKSLIVCSLFAALISVGAFIKIPLPNVPVTMQMMFVSMAGMTIGARDGAKSALIYLLIGLIGIPVFTQGGGIGYILKPSFGYILGFIPGAYITGKISRSGEYLSYIRLFTAGSLGVAAVYIIGLFYYIIITRLYMGIELELLEILSVCIIAVLPGDLIMTLAAAYIAFRAIPIIEKSTKPLY